MGDEQLLKSGLASILSGDLKTDELYRQMGLGNSGPAPTAKEKTSKNKAKKKGWWGGLFGGGKEESDDATLISGPRDFKREMHIGFNPQTGAFEVCPRSALPSSSLTLVASRVSLRSGKSCSALPASVKRKSSPTPKPWSR